MRYKVSPSSYDAAAINPSHVAWIRSVALVGALIVAGTIRRGPKLRFDPMRIGTGFGITAAEKEGTRSNGLKAADEMNVIDYSNSAMLDFIFLSFVSESFI